jgi:EAL domain-containing protein (putative c-di-GMP-specific phosphodiesterase class I)
VTAITGIARSLGCSVVAERIEDQTTLEILTDMGVMFGQGNLLHRPEPLEDVVRKLLERSTRTDSNAAA